MKPMRSLVAGLLAIVLAAGPASAVILGKDFIRFNNTTVLTADQAAGIGSRTTITAGTTQTQAGATLLSNGFNNVTTVATASDGVKLPVAAAGSVVTVKNSGAAVLRVWPNTSDKINALAANLSVDIPVNGTMTFRAIDAVTWETDEKLTLQAPSTQKGSLVLAAANSAGNTVTTITNASQAAARTYTIPDAGANASFLMTTGSATATSATTTEISTLAGVTGGTVTASKALVVDANKDLASLRDVTMRNLTATGTGAFTGAITPTGGIAAAGGFSATPRCIHTGGQSVTQSTDGTEVTITNTIMYVSELFIPANCTVTGAAVFWGATTDGNAKVALFDSAGTRVALSASTDVSGYTGDSFGSRIAFASPYSAKGPATYYLGVICDTNTNTINTHVLGNFGAGEITSLVYATEAGYATITPPTTFTTAKGPIATLY